MNGGYTIELDAEARALMAHVSRLPEVMVRALVRGLNEANNRALADIIPKHFTGPGPFPVEDHRLGQRSSHLYQSLRVTDATASGNTVTGALGTNVGYAAAHEYGFNGQVHVREHVRHMTIHSLEHFAGHHLRISEDGIDRLGLRTKSGKPRKSVTTIDRDVTVHAFVRWMQIPERAPLRTGLEENLPMYRATLSRAVIGSMKGGS